MISSKTKGIDFKSKAFQDHVRVARVARGARLTRWSKPTTTGMEPDGRITELPRAWQGTMTPMVFTTPC